MQSISESLKKQREQILQDGSEEALSRHTSLLEIAIISLYNRLVNRLGTDTEQFRSSGAVVALGAFGRGFIGPNQPIPLLFLKGEHLAWKDSWLEEISAPLTEAGWNVETRQATVDSLIELARDDFPFLFDLLEARYISGSRQLVDQLDKALELLMEGRQPEFLRTLHGSTIVRRMRLDEPQNWLEPDLVQNPGGLSDILALRAACRIASNIRYLEDAIFRGYLVREEVDLLQYAEKAYGRLLNFLQNVKGGTAGGVLHFGTQELIAERLGYTAPAGFLPVEAFMQRLQQLFHGVRRITQEFWERLQEALWGERAEDANGEELEPGLMVRSGKIILQPDRYPATAGHLIHLFALAAAHGLGLSNTTRQWVQHHRNTLDAAAGDPMVREELLKLIGSDGADLPLLRKFHDRGLLSALIPELASILGMVQHDAFHIYPVDEHHLRTLSVLKRLSKGDYADTQPQLTQIAQTIESPVSLYLAGLLHDIGKSAGQAHAFHGGEMIPSIARRLGMQPEESDVVQFLVSQHLLLNDNAAMRDLADEEMLLQCAQSIRTLDRLDLLVLLSFADMEATGPRAQDKWSQTPVLQLVGKIRDILEKGEPSSQAISERIARIRAVVAGEVADLMTMEQLETHFSELVPRYLLSMPPSAIVSHIRLEWELRRSSDPFVCQVSVSDSLAELTLMSWDAPGLLTRTAGILTLHDMNIVESQTFAKSNGVALLIFQCRLPEVEPDWKAVKKDMGRLLDGKLALDYRIAAHAIGQKEPQPTGRQSPSKIVVNNDSSAVYTILEVYTTDRIGLLYTITRTLLDLQIRIYVAKITTKVDQVADVFYIKNQQGEKLTDPEQIEEIKHALLYWLDGPGAQGR